MISLYLCDALRVHAEHYHELEPGHDHDQVWQTKAIQIGVCAPAVESITESL